MQFGNFLLKRRQDKKVSKINKFNVTDADLENYKEELKKLEQCK